MDLIDRAGSKFCFSPPPHHSSAAGFGAPALNSTTCVDRNVAYRNNPPQYWLNQRHKKPGMTGSDPTHIFFSPRFISYPMFSLVLAVNVLAFWLRSCPRSPLTLPTPISMPKSNVEEVLKSLHENGSAPPARTLCMGSTRYRLPTKTLPGSC